MNGQRGSVLAGILSLGLIMTLMAGGYLTLAGNSGRNDDTALEDTALRNAAESGLNIGLRWMRTQNPAYFGNASVTGMPLTISADGFVPMDGFLVRVRMLGTPGPNNLILESAATRGSRMDTCRITQQIADVTGHPPTGFASNLELGEWRISILPAN